MSAWEDESISAGLTRGQDPDTAHSALCYAERGWSVIPMQAVDFSGACTCGRADCPSPGKHPHVRWEKSTGESADEELVKDWWGRWPNANVGVVTGNVSGVAVIDVDPRHGGDETLTELESAHTAFPSTLESLTGGGGRHLWYTMPDHELISVELGDGVELKANHGIVVAPPSRHVSGVTYRWLDESLELSPLPEWISQVVSSPRPVPGGLEGQPVRTASERDEFRQAWLKAGIEINPGDAYYLCPFHDDHHPSLHVDANGCRWYCFACRFGGGTGRLLRELGLGRSGAPRTRLRGHVGGRQIVTLPGETAMEVVGESFHQDELLALTGGRRRFGGVDLETVADLIPIEGNGVEVQIDGNPVGFLQLPDTERCRYLIDESIDLHGFATCRASIRGGWDRGGSDVGLFGVTLWMSDDLN